MTSTWITNKKNKTLILFFGGFGCDDNLLSKSFLPADCDILFFYNYSNLDFDYDFSEYKNIGVIAWSFGVWVANYLLPYIPKVFVKIALNGTLSPVDDSLGIPKIIFEKTIESFDEDSKERFFRRICGTTVEYNNLSALISNRSADDLKNELIFLKECFENNNPQPQHWDIAVAGRSDRIFPISNMINAWGDAIYINEGSHLHLPSFGIAFAMVSDHAKKTQKGFDNIVDSYSRNAFVQRNIANNLILSFYDFAPISNASINNIFEIGCGTGFLTGELSKKFNKSAWALNDLSSKMCAQASSICSAENKILQGDIMTLKIEEKFDLIVSSSCFQWISDLRSLFSKLYRISNDSALLVFSTFGDKNFSQIKDLTGNSLNYYTKGEIKTLLTDAGYSILYASEDLIDIYLDSALSVLKHIKATGVNGKFTTFWTPKKLKEFSKIYKEKYPDGDDVVLTYNPIYIIAKKEKPL